MTFNRREQIGIGLIILTCLLATVSLFFTSPLAQDPGYHQFVDQRSFLGIPNFYNVVSNLPFLLVGCWGVYQFQSGAIRGYVAQVKAAYVMMYAAVALVSFGSAYYHLWPSNQTLLWDRLPMAIAFMSLFTIVVSEFASAKLGRILFLPLLLIGVSSVLYWYFGERGGAGDLRFYLLVQFLPIVLIPVLVIFFRPQFDQTSGYWYLLLVYIVAKLFENFDGQLYELSGFISGHSLKHIVAAIGLLVLLNAYRRREKAATDLFR